MRCGFIVAALGALCTGAAARELLDPVPVPANNYVLPVANGTVTLLDFLQSRPELSNLTAMIGQAAGESKSEDPESRHQTSAR
jgi:hypothetical protein